MFSNILRLEEEGFHIVCEDGFRADGERDCAKFSTSKHEPFATTRSQISNSEPQTKNLDPSVFSLTISLSHFSIPSSNVRPHSQFLQHYCSKVRTQGYK